MSSNEIDEKLKEIQKYWLDLLFDCKNKTNYEQAEQGIRWLYQISGLKIPQIIFVDSPLAAQKELQNWTKKNPIEIGGTTSLAGQLIYDKMEAQLRYKGVPRKYQRISLHMMLKVKGLTNNVYSSVKNQLMNTLDKKSISIGGRRTGICDFGDIAWWNFFYEFGMITSEGFEPVKDFFSSSVYDVILLDSCCIASNMPNQIHRDEWDNLHSETTSSIKFIDGYEQFYWHGVPVPNHWITDKTAIDGEMIQKETNSERRRCLFEILGTERYFEVQDGVVLLDSDFDNQGNEMKLFRSCKKSSLTKKYVQYLHVICPSTKRSYILYPPFQNSKNVWEAKASTFRNEAIQIRHGDVGLLNLNKEFLRPVIES
jgi:hypothetical protein